MSGVLQGLLASFSAAAGYSLYGWGINNIGVVGDNTTVNRSSPIQIGALTDWAQIAPSDGSFTLALKTDGTMWGWGSGSDYRLGNFDSFNRSSPVQIGALTNWTVVDAGDRSGLALNENNDLYAWGGGLFGATGLNTTSNTGIPTRVGLLSDWAQISTAGFVSSAIKTDSTLWAWGRNDKGQLGLNDTVNRSSPVQVGALSNWAQVSVATRYGISAVKTDGTLWSWGENGSGSLGLNIYHTIRRSSPVQVGALTNWSVVSCGLFRRGAIKTDGTLWAWGYNGQGRLGDGTTINRSSPVQIGASTDWVQFSGISSGSIALKTDGTIWTWGDNARSGHNDTIRRSSPVQLGSGTNWHQVASSNAVHAITKG